jgi:exoribonuclease R
VAHEGYSTDFRDIVSVAIDPEDALERDDAYSVAENDGKQWILIHIADASRY